MDNHRKMDLVRQIRRRCAWSQKDLAEAAQTSHTTISAYESGRKSPRLDTIQTFLEVASLEIELVDTVEWTEIKIEHGRAN